MIYQISCHKPLKHLIDISLSVDHIKDNRLIVNLPSWRPGRYEMANFAKNIYKIYAEDEEGKRLDIQKLSKDSWNITTEGAPKIVIRYQYYANQPDAGGSVADENQLYVNFINCMLYVEDRINDPCEIHLQLPGDFQIACGLPQSHHQLHARSFYHLVDSPMLASRNLKHLTYQTENYNFHVWINGAWSPNENKLLAAFQAFTIAQIRTFGSFPCPDYHFIFQILPYKFYHGVEHFNSTVLALGPSEDMNNPEAWENILGISSHELFHTWNIIRIRPKEMLPYNFAKENYFKTGYVAEGFTTYYGDLYLLRSHVFTEYVYFDNLNKSLKRYYENFGHQNLSVAESSYDLWLDGYSAGIPDRKVSIYVKGSLVALMLDLTIRSNTKNKNSLDDVMRQLWEDFGSKNIGYSEEDIQSIAEKLASTPLDDFFKNFVYGTAPIEVEMDKLLGFIGCKLGETVNASCAEAFYGFKTIVKEQSTTISATEPNSIADRLLAKDDEVIAIDGRKVTNNLDKLIDGKKTINLTVFRNHQLLTKRLENNGETYYKQHFIAKKLNATEEEKLNYKAWSTYEW